MAVDQLKPPRPSDRPDGTKLVQYDQYIDTQISRTRGMIKAVDVASALIVLAAGAIAFLLVAALAEHWLVRGGFGTSGRFALFGMLVAGAGYVVYRRLAPLFLRPINPVYAAQTIEQSSPTLKNSLLNLLLFRQRRSELPPAVYATLEEQAAQRLARVPIESAVDSTQLVRLGYLLVVIFTLAAVYVVFSPKSPLTAARRVLLPWADIPPASRVLIGDVQPGDVSVAQGELVDVSAEIRGLADDEEVLLRYTTDDEQAVGKAMPMTPGKLLNRFEGRLPKASRAGGMVGIAGDTRYWIEAGDARSREYAITVVTAPTIVVERVDYDFPDYTGYVDQHVDGLGNLNAIEGTRVTIHARANGPIDEASIDFEADGRRDIPMQVDGTEALATFTLALRDDRATQRYTSYAVRFTNDEGRQNNDPVQYPIEVSPDQSPEVELLAPQEKVLQVRVDQTVPIEIEAIDPDFLLGELRLKAEATGRPAIDQSLFTGAHEGKFVGRYQFTPSEHGLRVGDEVHYWAEAADNRTPEPDVSTSERQTIRITAPDPNRPPQQDPAADPQNQQPGENGQPGEQAEGQQGEQQQGEGQQQPFNREAQRSESQEQPANRGEEHGESEEAEGERGAEGQANQDQGGEESQAQEQPGGAGGIGRESEGGQQSGEGQQPGGQPGEAGERDESNKSGQGGAANQQRQPGEGENRPNDGQQPGGGDQPGDRQPNGEPNAEQSPVSPDGDNDGEAFERIGEFMRDRGQMPEEAGGKGKAGAEDAPGPDGNSGGEDAQARSDQSKREDNAGEGNPSETDSQDQPGPSKDSRGAGPGAETRPGEADEQLKEPQEGQPDGERDESDSPGGQQTSTKGPSGAGEQPGKDQGAPDSQPGMKPGDKREQQPTGESQTDDQEPPAGGKGKRESDSQGDQGGDRAGGGEEGGGQQAPREGTGSAGQNQSADEGAGQSTEQGAGRDSQSSGQDAQAEGKTGQSSGQQPGEGSQEREGQGKESGGDAERGGKPGAVREPGSENAPAGSDQSKGEEGQDAPSDRDAERNASGTPTGAGRPGQGAMEPSPVDGDAPDADAANLDYAREQTDLVLEKLSDQLKRNEVDRELLDQLGWTEEELRRFVERWRTLKSMASNDEPAADAAQRELDESLRSLGLRRGPLRQSQQQADKLRDLREGYRGPVPQEYRDRLRAYNEGVSRSRQEAE